jgi:phosphoesterase RecJ-like protein
MISKEQIRDLVNSSQKILVISHMNADGDAMGSALGLAEALATRGKEVSVRIPPPVPSLYTYLLGADLINQPEKFEPELVIVVDAADITRVPGTLNGISEEVLRLNIDHHPDNTLFADVNYVVPEASSTSEILTALLQEWGWEISAEAADCFYTGILTDTGSFQYSNTTEVTFAVARELKGLGADTSGIAHKIFRSKSKSRKKLEQLAAINDTFECDDRLLYTSVTLEMKEKAGATPEDAYSIISELSGTESVDLVISFEEKTPNLTRVSLRSSRGFDCSELAHQFGGGGHKAASGINIDDSLENAMNKVLTKAREALRQEVRKEMALTF